MSGSTNCSSSGFKLALSHHMDMPIMDQVGISISPGSMVQIAVSPTLINITQSAFERFDAKERNCYMSHGEIELPHFKLEDDYKYEVIKYIFFERGNSFVIFEIYTHF